MISLYSSSALPADLARRMTKWEFRRVVGPLAAAIHTYFPFELGTKWITRPPPHLYQGAPP